MSHSRRHAREVALQILYQHDLKSTMDSSVQETPSLIEIQGEIEKHFEHFSVTDGVRAFAADLAAGTLQNQAKIDSKIEAFANHWKISRMSAIDRNLLRMSCFEMTHLKEIPQSVTINEAIEIAKLFGSEESPSFINAILDSIRKETESREATAETTPEATRS